MSKIGNPSGGGGADKKSYEFLFISGVYIFQNTMVRGGGGERGGGGKNMRGGIYKSFKEWFFFFLS